MQLFRQSWHRAWEALGAEPAPGLFERLIACYGEPHRKYHTLQHLHECLETLQANLPLAEHPGEVELALWFHDAVYAVKRHDNEQQSALWARREATAGGAAEDVAERIHALVLATAHSALPATADQRLLVDIDLSILAAEPDRFGEYERQVRDEYDWVPGWLYRRNRQAVLDGFLARGHIYSSEQFRARLEARARENLQRREASPPLSGLSRLAVELVFFGIKEARACLFVVLFFAAVFTVPRNGLLGLPRYDVLLVIALAIQGWMVWAKIETVDEFKAVMLFHAVGFGLEVFKTSSGIRSWSYPDFAYSKVLGVPLFSGFMYAAVGSYIIQAWRLLEIRVRHHPPYWMAALLALVIYANFFTHHYIGDYRWYIAACALGLYARTTVVFRPLDRDRRMPLLLGFVLTGFFVWLAENISTFFGVWRYPNQLGAWSSVHVGKWSSWSLLIIMTFTIVANLKHIKERVHVPD